MIRTTRVYALILAVIFPNVYADACKKTPGTISCSEGTTDGVTGDGIIIINGTTINGATKVNGLLTANKADFSSLDVNGNASLTQCTIRKSTQIKGILNASSTQFEQAIDIYSNSIKFTRTIVNGDLRVHSTNNTKQEIYLSRYSEIKGNIIFDEGHGTVYASSNAKIIGKVLGGTLVAK